MDDLRSLSQNAADGPYAARYPADGPDGTGLALYNAVKSGALPQHLEYNVIAPIRTIGIGADTLLKSSFWYATVEEAPQASDATFVSISLRTSVARAWRDATPSGTISMLPFEGAHWRFEQPVSFVQFHLPFPLMDTVCGAMFDREFTHSDLRTPADVRDARLSAAVRTVHDRISSIEPTNLLLDSWALLLSEALLRRLSSHGERHPRASFGKIAGRGIARVVDYIEAGIDQDLRLTSLAGVAAMSVYHFARCFKDTIGMSPHAYVLSRRVIRARAMLSRRDCSLAHVALSCGFSSQAHFTTAFHRSLRVTPGEYRRSVHS